MDNLLISGGAGMIGSNLLNHLNNLGKTNITVLDCFDGERGNLKWKNLVGKKFNDVIDLKDFDKFLLHDLRQFDTVIHLGALNDTSNKNFMEFYNKNYLFSKKLFENISTKCKFIYASSCSTYGTSLTFDDDVEKLNSLKPTNAYGYSKHLFDLYLYNKGVFKDVGYKSIRRVEDQRIVGLKLSNVFGENEYHKQHYSSYFYRLFVEIEKSIKEKRQPTIKLFKREDEAMPVMKRDFIYVDDVCKIICNILEKGIKKNNIYNVGTNNAITWEECITTIIDTYNNEIAQTSLPFKNLINVDNINYVEIPEHLREGYQYFTKANINKLRTDYPLFDYDELFDSAKNGLENYVKNYFNGKKYV